jgi:3-deoxy-manno-octulosonate cytidylyltransferase (CMP-KDO synthetase)
MKILAIIPARMKSSRFPGKPMATINGRPMIEHVFKSVNSCKLINKTVVATCDKIISNHINAIGGISIMTSSKHKRATDRCAEALNKLERFQKSIYDIIVMVQGDEPMVSPKMISSGIKYLLKNKKLNVVNLISKISSREEFNDKNCIKVVFDKKFNALYFSRSPIPSDTRIKHNNFYKQVCVMPFRRDFLLNYLKMKETTLEAQESIDMMRIIENGYKIGLVKTNQKTFSVDTQKDLKKVRLYIKN